VQTSRPGGGRPRIGEPGREIPATADRGPRNASAQTNIRLADGQPAQIQATAKRRVCSGGQVIRRAIDRLVIGTIPLPTGPEDIPPTGGRTARRSVVLGEERTDKLGSLADQLTDVIGLIGWRAGGIPDRAERMNALIRYALARDVAKT
jgi:hypothetical protein